MQVLKLIEIYMEGAGAAAPSAFVAKLHELLAADVIANNPAYADLFWSELKQALLAKIAAFPQPATDDTSETKCVSSKHKVSTSLLANFCHLFSAYWKRDNNNNNNKEQLTPLVRLLFDVCRADMQCAAGSVDALVKLCACFPMTPVYLDWFLSVSEDVDVDSGAADNLGLFNERVVRPLVESVLAQATPIEPVADFTLAALVDLFFLLNNNNTNNNEAETIATLDRYLFADADTSRVSPHLFNLLRRYYSSKSAATASENAVVTQWIVKSERAQQQLHELLFSPQRLFASASTTSDAANLVVRLLADVSSVENDADARQLLDKLIAWSITAMLDFVASSSALTPPASVDLTHVANYIAFGRSVTRHERFDALRNCECSSLWRMLLSNLTLSIRSSEPPLDFTPLNEQLAKELLRRDNYAELVAFLVEHFTPARDDDDSRRRLDSFQLDRLVMTLIRLFQSQQQRASFVAWWRFFYAEVLFPASQSGDTQSPRLHISFASVFDELLEQADILRSLFADKRLNALYTHMHHRCCTLDSHGDSTSAAADKKLAALNKVYFGLCSLTNLQSIEAELDECLLPLDAESLARCTWLLLAALLLAHKVETSALFDERRVHVYLKSQRLVRGVRRKLHSLLAHSSGFVPKMLAFVNDDANRDTLEHWTRILFARDAAHFPVSIVTNHSRLTFIFKFKYIFYRDRD